MIEVRGKNDKWVVLNARDIKCVTFDRQANDREKFKITIHYFGDEGELELHGLFTEAECCDFRNALCTPSWPVLQNPVGFSIPTVDVVG